MTVPELCALTHNFFDRADDPVAGEFAFEPDTVPAGVVPGQYFLVCGSIFNDGVHKAGDGDLVAETFTGTVQPMRVPPALWRLLKNRHIRQGSALRRSVCVPVLCRVVRHDGYRRGRLPADGKTHYKSEINQWRKM